MTKSYITDYNCLSPLGFSVDENWEALSKGYSGLKKQIKNGTQYFTGTIDDDKIERAFAQISSNEFSRLEKMLILALKPIVERHQPGKKSLLVFSTTKGNISALEGRETAPAESFLATTAQKIAHFFGFEMRPVVVSNACVSGVMAVSVAKKMMSSGYCTDAFVIAADEVTEFVLSGFKSFQALSAEPCKPYDKNRDGISIGEAAAAVYITAEQPVHQISFEILGESSINDANHISGPSRDGEGLLRSILTAMKEARIAPDQIDYISAHGTATVYNDEMESFAFSRAGLSEVPLNSLKGFYGHCLGASGLVETIMAMESAKHNLLIKNLNFNETGVSQPIHILTENTPKTVNIFLKTASGFGGSNSAIILKKVGHESA